MHYVIHRLRGHHKNNGGYCDVLITQQVIGGYKTVYYLGCDKTTDTIESYDLGCGKTEDTVESVTILY